MRTKFWTMLFNPGDMIAIGPTVATTTLHSREEIIENPKKFENCQFFCINPVKDKRTDSSVTSYRNFLIEFDSGTMEEQMRAIIESKIPYSSIVTSGNKSLHVIVSLEDPLPDLNTYRQYANRVYKTMEKYGIDKSCKNPSRLSRVPNVFRDNGNLQELKVVKNGYDN